MNIIKETRFVLFVVALLVVFAFAVHDKGTYDHHDDDRAYTETPPPPPPPTCVPGFGYGMFTNGPQHLESNLLVDSYNSASGAYAAGGCSGNLGTNSTSSSAVQIESNTTICGTLTTGAGGNVSTGSGDVYTLPKVTLPAPVTFATVTLPSPALPANGNGNFSDGTTHALAPNSSYTTWDCSGNGTVLSLSAGSYVVGDINLMTRCRIEVTSGPVLVYFTADFQMAQNSSINAPPSSGVPSNLIFLGVNSGSPIIHFEANTSTYAGIYAPHSLIHFEANTDFYGAAVGQDYHGESNSKLHYDLALATTNLGTIGCPVNEVSRSSPIVATVGASQTAVVQGSFTPPSGGAAAITSLGSVAGWTFPYITGKLRARLASTITTTTTFYGAGTVIFNVKNGIPTVNTTTCTALNGTCRRVFTNTSTPDATTGVAWHPTTTQLIDANASAIGPLIVADGSGPGQISGISGGTYYKTIIDKVLNGVLGGVDRSTVAVIGPSNVAGVGTRPTMVYFGALDGMLHAACATTGGATASQPSSVCPALGTELWAFLPRSQLPLLATNKQRIDGSPRVVDVFGDFTTAAANGARSWHTILTFQTGFIGTSKGATYALDITDPASPVVLWEYTTPSSPAVLDLGAGLTMLAGQARIGGTMTNIGVIETSNGGSGGAGVVATAVQLETGSRLWRFGYAYPSPPRGSAADLPLPATGIVGGAVGVDLVGSGFLTDVVFGDLYGDIWRLDITTGISRNPSSTPLFSFTTNKHPFGAPPAIYANSGNPLIQYAVFVSGGYDDPTSTAWSTGTQFVIGAKLNSTAATISETTTASTTGPLSFNSTITGGDKGFSQALVVGGQIFVTSDSGDVSSATYGATSATSGHLMTLNTATGTTVITTTGSGAGSVANAGTTLYGSGATGQAQLVSAASTTGQTVDSATTPKLTRNLWLRTQ